MSSQFNYRADTQAPTLSRTLAQTIYCHIVRSNQPLSVKIRYKAKCLFNLLQCCRSKLGYKYDLQFSCKKVRYNKGQSVKGAFECVWKLQSLPSRMKRGEVRSGKALTLQHIRLFDFWSYSGAIWAETNKS